MTFLLISKLGIQYLFMNDEDDILSSGSQCVRPSGRFKVMVPLRLAWPRLWETAPYLCFLFRASSDEASQLSFVSGRRSFRIEARSVIL